jgi:endonuclease YncB( thermonuclease family)
LKSFRHACALCVAYDAAMRTVVVMIVIVLVGLVQDAPAFWDPVTEQCRPPAQNGTASAIDGDTLLLTSDSGLKTVMRLISIDAPELHQECRIDGEPWSCGYVARDTLDDLIAGVSLSCLPCGYNRDGAMLALCTDGDRDIGAEVLREGMATSFAFFSNGMHAAESQAESAGRGLWQGDWVHPQIWRQGVRLGEEPCQGCYLPQ